MVNLFFLDLLLCGVLKDEYVREILCEKERMVECGGEMGLGG